jgi:hypothetical protein
MKRASLIVFFIVSVVKTLSAQNRVHIKIYGNFNVDGVIFKKEYEPNFQFNDIYERFTPTTEDVVRCEYILLSSWYKRDMLRVMKSSKSQYIGYVNRNKDSVIVLQILNFKNKQKASIEFQDWKNRFLIGFHGFFERNTHMFEVNISKKSISIQ